jgi:rubrerythrin
MYFSDDYDEDDFSDLDDPETDEYEVENYISRTYVCEDCDFRWADKIYPDRNDFPDYDDELGHDHVCPMCGSINVSFY